MFIKKFKSMQENNGLFLGISEDMVRGTYLQYFPGGNYYPFLGMICKMTNGVVSIISTDRSIFIGLNLVGLRMLLERGSPCEKLMKLEREMIEELKEEGITIIKREELIREMKILKEGIFKDNISRKEKKC